MTSEAQLVIEIWEAVRDVIPFSKKSNAAIGILAAIAEYGFDRSELAAIEDEDDDLSEAFSHVFGDDDRDDYPDEEEL